MEILYPKFSKLIGFNCHNHKEPFYTLASIDFSVRNYNLLFNYHIPMGFTSDGCTLVLKVLWLIVGCPHTPEFLTASIIHDYFCKNKYLIDRKTASEIFVEILILEGVVESKARLMGFVMNLYQKHIEGWE